MVMINTRPNFVVENPNFLGFSTPEGQARAEKYKGPRHTAAKFNSLYIHGSLERHCGYDVALFTCGTVKDKDVQRVVVIDPQEECHDCILVSVHYNDSRYGLVVWPAEAKETYSYLKQARENASASGFSRIFL
jgi:hypothetical protein